MSAERIAGLKGVGAVLGCVPETVIVLASRPWDPLPLFRIDGIQRAWLPHVEAWQRRRDDMAAWRRLGPARPTLPIFEGWERIAEQAEISVDVLQECARRYDPARPRKKLLPVFGLDADDLAMVPGGPFTSPLERVLGTDHLRRVWLYQGALWDWIRSRTELYVTGEARPRERVAGPQMSLFTP